MTQRQLIQLKYNGKCAYTGTDLLPNWQVDHLEPIRRNPDGSCLNPECNTPENMIPAQRIINHYKHSLSLEDFRDRVSNLHIVIGKLPVNPTTRKSIKRKAYMLEIAALFGITTDKPFEGKFYFETI